MYVYSGISDQWHNLSRENYQINFTFLQDGGLSMTSNLGSKKRKKWFKLSHAAMKCLIEEASIFNSSIF